MWRLASLCPTTADNILIKFFRPLTASYWPGEELANFPDYPVSLTLVPLGHWIMAVSLPHNKMAVPVVAHLLYPALCSFRLDGYGLSECKSRDLSKHRSCRFQNGVLSFKPNMAASARKQNGCLSRSDKKAASYQYTRTI